MGGMCEVRLSASAGNGSPSIRRRVVRVKDFVGFRVEQRFYVSLAFFRKGDFLYYYFGN